ncbi:MAG TPA: bifunctional ADP-dependent NAD(P)H-hydrate dehydratase/NAD(P)H-hydrate epimerase, partial [Synergistaceae bacterium]|nr:bifunctional ADP-dependent NAD(P)H-hydrate dehydratase/NAD(P)H-hydrate epimerase [Synergistaceae bacterium]
CSCLKDSYVGLCGENRDMALLAGVPVVSSQERSDEEIAQTIRSSRLVVDALLGIGSRGEPKGEVARLIGLASCAPSIISLDIPSGVDPRTGAIPGRLIAAAMTLTMIAPKSGLALSPGRGAAGLVRTVDIGY